MKRVFFLDRPGDSKYEFSSFSKPKVVVEVDFQSGREPDERVREWIEGLVRQTLEKEVEIKVEEEEGEKQGGYSDKELLAFAREVRDVEVGDDEVILQVLYVSSSSQYPSNTGLVLSGDEIFIFLGTRFMKRRILNKRELVLKSQH